MTLAYVLDLFPGVGLVVLGCDQVGLVVLFSCPEVHQEHVVRVGDVGPAEPGVEQVEEGIDGNVAIPEILWL